MSQLFRLTRLEGLAVFLTALLVSLPHPLVAQNQSSAEEDEIRVAVPDTSGSVGDQMIIPIRTGDLSGRKINSYFYELVYDSAVLKIRGVKQQGSLSSGGRVRTGTEEDTLRIVYSSSGQLSGSGPLLYLKVEVLEEGTSSLALSGYYTNIDLERVPTSLLSGAFTTEAEKQTVGSDGSFEFGAAGVSLDFFGVSGQDTVSVAKFDIPPFGTDGISESNVSRYWFEVRAGPQLSFDSTEVQFDVNSLRGISDPDNVRIYKRPTSRENSFTARATSYNSGENELVVVADSLSEFVMASDSEPLPVEFAGLEAQRQGEQAVLLRWQTASETNNAGFAVQRAEGAGEWQKVGFVEGEGTTSSINSYRFTDRSIPFEAGMVRYRLKQVDTGGATHLGPSVTVRLGTPERIALERPYPSPASHSVTVRYAVPQSKTVTLQLYDVLGRRVKTIVQGSRKGRFEQRIETSSLPSGVYFVRLQAGDIVKTERFTVAR